MFLVLEEESTNSTATSHRRAVAAHRDVDVEQPAQQRTTAASGSRACCRAYGRSLQRFELNGNFLRRSAAVVVAGTRGRLGGRSRFRRCVSVPAGAQGRGVDLGRRSLLRCCYCNPPPTSRPAATQLVVHTPRFEVLGSNVATESAPARANGLASIAPAKPSLPPQRCSWWRRTGPHSMGFPSQALSSIRHSPVVQLRSPLLCSAQTRWTAAPSIHPSLTAAACRRSLAHGRALAEPRAERRIEPHLRSELDDFC